MYALVPMCTDRLQSMLQPAGRPGDTGTRGRTAALPIWILAMNVRQAERMAGGGSMVLRWSGTRCFPSETQVQSVQ